MQAGPTGGAGTQTSSNCQEPWGSGRLTSIDVSMGSHKGKAKIRSPRHREHTGGCQWGGSWWRDGV